MMVHTSLLSGGGEGGTAKVLARLGVNSADYYCIQLVAGSDVFQLAKLVSSSFTTLKSMALAGLAGNTLYPVELFVEDSLQTAWATDGTTIVTDSAADTAHNGQNSRSAGLGGGGTNWSVFPSIVVCSDRVLTISDIPEGIGLVGQVLNGSGAVVAAAAESSGTISINLSLYTEEQAAGTGGNEQIPVGGHPALVIMEGAYEVARYDVDADEYTGALVYGGGTYAWADA